MIYFTSDLHFGHANAIKFTNRPFANVEDMNERLINNINAKVGLHDELYILGDFSFKLGKAEAVAARRRIPCRKVHLIYGNHDMRFDGERVFSTTRDYAKIKTPRGKVVLFHYPIADWDGMYHGSIHLHGHIHSTGEYNRQNLAAGRRIWDVGVDANNYEPISLEDIWENMDIAQ